MHTVYIKTLYGELRSFMERCLTEEARNKKGLPFIKIAQTFSSPECYCKRVNGHQS